VATPSPYFIGKRQEFLFSQYLPDRFTYLIFDGGRSPRRRIRVTISLLKLCMDI
jgi:hypothetical protein